MVLHRILLTEDDSSSFFFFSPLHVSDIDIPWLTQDSIIEKINGNPQAGWKASINSRLEKYTVSSRAQFYSVRFILNVNGTLSLINL